MIFNANLPAVSKKHVFCENNTVKEPVKIALADYFNSEYPLEDINGDNCPDISHGEVAKCILKSYLKVPAEIIPFELGEYDGIMEISSEKLLEELSNIEKRDDIRYANLSVGEMLNFDELTKVSKPDFEIEIPAGDSVDLSINAPQNREILKQLVQIAEPCEVRPEVMKKLSNISRTKKVFISAGNEGEEYFNSMSLVKNTNSVGNMDEKFKKHPASANNAFVSIFARGVYRIRPVMQDGTTVGFDITEDGKIDVPLEKITGYETVKNIVGQNENTVKAKEKDYEQLAGLRDYEDISGKKLYSVDRLVKKELLKSDNIEKLKSKDFYIDAGTYLTYKIGCYNKKPRFAFRFKDGKAKYISFPPTLAASSFSAPAALAQVVNEDALRQNKLSVSA